jgi:hypothetical protein
MDENESSKWIEYQKVYQKKYYVDNKDNIDIRRKERINCKCGKNVGRHNYIQHTKTNVHLNDC